MYAIILVSSRSNVETTINHNYLIHLCLRLYSIDGREEFQRKHPGSMQVQLQNLPEMLTCITDVSL